MNNRADEIAHKTLLTGLRVAATTIEEHCNGDPFAYIGTCMQSAFAAALRAYAEEAARTRLWEKGDLNHLSCGCWFRACSAAHEEPVRDAEEARRDER